MYVHQPGNGAGQTQGSNQMATEINYAALSNFCEENKTPVVVDNAKRLATRRAFRNGVLVGLFGPAIISMIVQFMAIV
jgi:hypothetical protein